MKRVDVVFGHGALAKAIATASATRNPTVLVSNGAPIEGPWLWRRAEVATGAGIRSALRDSTHIVCVLEPAEAAHGLLLVAKAETGLQSASLAIPSGTSPVQGLDPSWNLLETGVPWGPGDPLYDRWEAAAARGRPILVPNPGRIPSLPVGKAVAALQQLAELKGQRWRLPGTSRSLMELARAGWPNTRPLPIPTVCAPWLLGVPRALLLERVARPMPSPWTPGLGIANSGHP